MSYIYEELKDLAEQGKKKFPQNGINGSIEGLVLGGLAGGLGAYITTPLDVVKTRLQVQDPTVKYKEGGRKVQKGFSGELFRESCGIFRRQHSPSWPWNSLRDNFREKGNSNNVASNLSRERKRSSSVHEVNEN